MYNREEIKERLVYAVNNSVSLAAANRNYFPDMNIKTFKKLAKEFDVFKPNQAGKGVDFKKDLPHLYDKNKENFMNSLTQNSTLQSNKLRLRLFKYELKEKRCEICGLTEWNGLPIPLEVHHNDGDKTNNELSNLTIVCPNCHAQTDNYKSKNKFYKNKDADVAE